MVFTIFTILHGQFIFGPRPVLLPDVLLDVGTLANGHDWDPNEQRNAADQSKQNGSLIISRSQKIPSQSSAARDDAIEETNSEKAIATLCVARFIEENGWVPLGDAELAENQDANVNDQKWTEDWVDSLGAKVTR